MRETIRTAVHNPGIISLRERVRTPPLTHAAEMLPEEWPDRRGCSLYSEVLEGAGIVSPVDVEGGQ
jgi:hypothetical protein